MFPHASVKPFIGLAITGLLLTGCQSTATVLPDVFMAQEITPLSTSHSMNDHLGRQDAISPTSGVSYRVYQLPLQDEPVLITVSASEFIPQLALFSEDGSLLARNYSYEYTTSLMHRTTRPGTHLLVVSSTEPRQGGTFNLAVETLEDQGDFELGVPSQVTGILSSRLISHPRRNTPMDRYILTVDEAATIEIRMSSDDFDTYLSLAHMNSSQVIAENDDWGGTTNSRILTHLDPGQYEVWASSFGGHAQGRYELTTRSTASQISEAFVFGELYLGMLGEPRSDIPGSHRTGQPLSFSLEEASVIQAELRSDSFDAFLVLTTADGHFITEDDDSAGSLDARIIHNLPAGDYQLWASSFSDRESGEYELDTQLLAEPEVLSIELGESLQGHLSRESGVSHTRQTYAQHYTFELSQATDVVIDLSSNDFDTYLLLKSSTGALLESNDDIASGNTDSRIRTRLEAGSYQIVATAFTFSATGQYELSLREASTAASGGSKL